MHYLEEVSMRMVAAAAIIGLFAILLLGFAVPPSHGGGPGPTVVAASVVSMDGGSVASLDGGEECNKCWSDCDLPPPSSPCEEFCFEPNCWECSGWEPDCWQGSCEQLVQGYWEGQTFCGEICPDEEEKYLGIVDECPHNVTLLLDGTAPPSGPNGSEDSAAMEDLVWLERGDRGVLYRSGCDGSGIGRVYSADHTERISLKLRDLTL